MSKHDFANEFESLFNIDVTAENPTSYPNLLCAPHTTLFYNARSKGLDNYKTKVQLFLFESVVCKIESPCHLCVHKKKVQSTLDKDAQKLTKIKADILKLFGKLDCDNKIDCMVSIARIMTSDQLAKFMENLGMHTHEEIKKDCDSIEGVYKDPKYLESFDISNYMLQRNDLIVSFICGAAQINPGEMLNHPKTSLHVCGIVESIYKLANPCFVGPVSFMNNLTILQMGGSKTAVNVVGSQGAGGKYDTVTSWLENASQQMKLTCPDGDVMFILDNEQCVGKSWSLKVNNKVKMSVITNIAVAQLESVPKVQTEDTLHPRKWHKVVDNEDVVSDMAESDETSPRIIDLKSKHYDQLFYYLDFAIQQVLSEQKETNYVDNIAYTDDIDEAVKDEINRSEFKECLKCGCLNEKNKRKCTACKESLPTVKEYAAKIVKPKKQPITKQEEVVIDLGSKKEMSSDNLVTDFATIPTAHKETGIPISLIDPVFVNPNSLQTLALVLRHIGKEAGLKIYGGTEREWTSVACDGLPYSLIMKLKEEAFICNECQSKIMGRGSMEAHWTSSHSDIPCKDFAKEFNWVNLKVGDGHYEMNMMKSFIELNWETYIQELVQRMGWRSEAALACAKKCTDNHKTWQVILTFHIGSLLELVVPYVRKCLKENVKPDVQNFYSYAKTVKSPNFHYLFEMCSRYSQGIINLRQAIRRNNSQLAQSAKWMTKELFHGRRHPVYQEIEIMEQFQRAVRPEKLREFEERHESMSKTSGVKGKNKGQGFDFILEEENKDIKQWIKRGVPSDNMWLSVIRNKASLKEIKTRIQNIIGCDEGSDKIMNLSDLIFEWRTALRRNNHLSDLDSASHTTIKGDELHYNLKNFTSIAKTKRGYRILDMLLQQDPPEDLDLSHPVYVTKREYEEATSLQNQTIREIDRKSLLLVSSIPDTVLQTELKEKYKKKVLKKRKDEHIKFHQEVEAALSSSLLSMEEGGVHTE